jgi:hypothetical protein
MKPKTKTVVFIIMSFLLGILCGWFLEDRILNRVPSHQGGGHREFVKILNERLHLSEFQMVQVDSILESRKQTMEIYKKNVMAMRDSARMDIRRILNDEQGKIFVEFNQEKDREETKRWERETQKQK